MRDLDRIREVREFRVTGPQLTTFAISALVLIGSVFVVGYQLGRLQAPVDLALLAPSTGDERRDPSAMLAEMMAERSTHTAQTPPRLPRSGLVASDVAALSEETEINPQPRTSVADLEPREADPEAIVSIASHPPEVVPDLAVESVEPEPTPAPAKPEPVAAASTPTPTPASAIVALPSAPQGQGFTVQVGAYDSQEEASRVIAQLRALGLPVFHVAAVVNGKTWHRVRVGLHPTRADAEASAEQLAGSAPFPPFVTTQP